MPSHAHSPAMVLQQAIINAGHAVSPPTAADWACYVDYMPDGPEVGDRAVCVYNTTPILDGRIMTTGKHIEHPGWQVKVRAPNHPTGFGKIKDILQFFEGVLRLSVTIGSDSYKIQSISRTSGIVPIGRGKDMQQREHFTINGITTIFEI